MAKTAKSSMNTFGGGRLSQLNNQGNNPFKGAHKRTMSTTLQHYDDETKVGQKNNIIT
jgi:hypothetical protein